MADQVKVISDSAERVALDLFYHIARAEGDEKKARAYYLSLYSECIKVVRSGHYESK